MNEPLELLRSSYAPEVVEPAILARARNNLMNTISSAALKASAGDTQVGSHAHPNPVGFEHDASVGYSAWLGVAASAPPAKKRRLLASAATFAIVALFGVVAFALARQDPDRALSTADTQVEDQAPVEDEADTSQSAVFLSPSQLIRGVDVPLVMLDSGTSDGQTCLAVAPDLRTELRGLSPIAESFRLSPGLSEVDTLVDFGNGLITCAEGRAIGSTIGASPAQFGMPNDPLPLYFIGGIGGQEGRVSFNGRIGDNVERVSLLSDQVEDQNFQRLGDLFLIDAVVTGRLPDVEDLQIEILLADGSAQQQSLYVEAQGACLDDLACLGQWFVSAFESANDTDSPAQAEVLADFELTQVEYDAALSQFQACLPADVEPLVDVGSSTAVHVLDCYETHIEFVEQARLVQNDALRVAAPDEWDRLFELEMQMQREASIEEQIDNSSATQQEMAADGEIEFSEYKDAVTATINCLLDAGLVVDGPFPDPSRPGFLNFSYGSQSGLETDLDTIEPIFSGCYNEHLSAIDQAYGFQNRPTGDELRAQESEIARCIEDRFGVDFEGQDQDEVIAEIQRVNPSFYVECSVEVLGG